MKKDSSRAVKNLDQSCTDHNVSSEGPNDLTIIGDERVPRAWNDDAGPELAQGKPHIESNNQSYSRKGARTAKGKAIASRNAVKHGIFSKILLTSESREKYDSLLSGLWEHFKLVGTLEEILVEKIAVTIWRYRRLISTETTEIKGGNPLDFESSDSRS